MDSTFWYRTKAVNFGSVPGIAGVSARSPQKPHFLGNDAPWRPINPKAPSPPGGGEGAWRSG